MSFDLRDQLSDLDKKILFNYIMSFGYSEGLPKEYFVGVDTFLENWAKSKIRLYHFLGNNLIVKVPFSYQKDKEEISREIEALLVSSKFLPEFDIFLDKNIKKSRPYRDLNYEEQNLLMTFNRKITYINDKIDLNLKIKPEGYQKMLQLSKDMKPIRAIQKILKYFDAPENLMKLFEQFRCEHSLIHNDEMIKTNLVFSIHPMDFITMSDNANNWESCMSWINDGCYHTGTVEMMNSNVVVCVYLESKTPFVFRDSLKDYSSSNINKSMCMNDPVEEWSWNNKKWRQLFYINKDIIVSGKSYPYTIDKVSKKAIEILRDLAFKNNKWTYKYGIEKYYDMEPIWSMFRMENQREWADLGINKKKNILFDSKIMYNDMFNDHNYTYWCVRNPVKKTKIINYSGKVNCLCCNKNLQIERDYPEDYNDRYIFNQDLICDSCRNTSRCPLCEESFKQKYKFVFDGGEGICCENCFNTRFRRCPCCNKNIIDIEKARHIEITSLEYKDFYSVFPITKKDYLYYKAHHDPASSFLKGITIKVCQECSENDEILKKKFKIDSIIREKPHIWSLTTIYGITNQPMETFFPYFIDVLEPIKVISKTPVS